MAAKKLLAVAASVEGATGLALMVYPPVVALPLLGDSVSGPGVAVGRVAGFALLSLGVACWPSKSTEQPLYGMLTYSTLAMLYLIRIGIRGAPVGPLLWPGVAAHAVIIALLVWAWRKEHKSPAAAT